MSKIKHFLYLLCGVMFISLNLSGCTLLSEAQIKDLPIVWPGGDQGFKWGIGFDPYPTAVHREEYFNKTIDQAKNLHVKWLRIGVPNWDDAELTFTTSVVERCRNEGFQTVLILEPKVDYQELNDSFQDGYDQAYKVASKFPYITYFQIGNEPAASALRENWPGVTEDSFDVGRYKNVLLWLEGASAGIKKANPVAKKIINGHWLHVGFFQMLNKDKLEYDIIGWDWHQQNPDLTAVKNQDQTYNLIDMLSKLGKDLWITEAGLLEGSKYSEQEQSDFLEKLIEQVYSSDLFSGFFAFMLNDSFPRKNNDNNQLGLVKIFKNELRHWEIGEPKKAYYTYQKLVKGLD